MLFEKILVPIDGSAYSLKALKFAAGIAKNSKSEKIALINVYSTASERAILTDAGMESRIVLAVEKIQKESASILDHGEKMVEAEGLNVEKISVDGHVTEEIINAAEKGKFDLIVMSHRGRSKIKLILLGHVCEEVTRYAPCPVLVVK